MNLILALTWAALSGSFTLLNLIAGFCLGFAVLYITRHIAGVPTYGQRLVKVLGLGLFFVVELVKANLRVALDVLTPGLLIRPAVIAVPLDAHTDTEILVLADLVSLTPGTLILDVSSDRTVMYVHAMYADERDEVVRQIKDGFERRVVEVMR